MDARETMQAAVPATRGQVELIATVGGALALVALAGWTLLHQVGEGSLYDWDEATYGQIAREMARSPDWLTPHWNGQIFFDKPPVLFWLMALGLNQGLTPELAIRLPVALFGLLAVVLTGALGWAMAGRAVGLAAAALLLLASPAFSSSFVGLARQGMLDVPLTAATTWALLHFWLGLKQPRHWLAMGVPLGLAVMFRSYSAVTPFAVVAACVACLPLVERARLSAARWRALGGGLLGALAIALPWHLLQWARYGQFFWDEYVGHNLFRKVGSATDSLTGDWRYYLDIIREGLPYWWLLVPPALAWALWRLLRGRDARALLLLAWAGVPFALYTLAATKLAWYILPIYPALALLVAWGLATLLPRAWPVRALALAALLVAVALWNRATVEPLHLSWAVKAVGWCAVNAVPSGETIAFFDPERSYESDQHAFWNIRPSVRFYADRPMVARWTRDEVAQWFAAGGRFVWSHAATIEQLDGLAEVVGREDDQVLLRRVGEAEEVAEGACRR